MRTVLRRGISNAALILASMMLRKSANADPIIDWVFIALISIHLIFEDE